MATTVFEPHDDLRHRPPEGQKMRDSLFWQMILPDHQLGFQVYLFANERGKAGYNVAVWGQGEEPLALELQLGDIPPEADFDDFAFAGLELRQPELRRTAELRYESEAVSLAFDFTALHEAFSYHRNPHGIPHWFATNRFEQTGHVTGVLEVGGRRIELDRIGHRDHSWGHRNWGYPHHWKWFIAYTESGRIVNGWIWIAQGEWGFAGYVVRDGEPIPVVDIKAHASYHDDMTQRSLEAELTDERGGVTRLEMESYGVVKLPSNDRFGTIIMEAACRATVDGEAGAAQFETHWPVAYLEHLVASRKP